MKKFIHIILFSFLVQISFGQSIKGIVVDGITDAPIPNANIQLQFSNLGTNSNEQGQFAIDIKSTSANLIFTHVNYEKHIEFIDVNLKFITVKLYPKSNIIDEISISARSPLDTISQQKQYSVTSYELLEDYVFWIENHGTLKRKLSFKNLSSNLEKSIWLDTIKNVEVLHRSCNQRMYLTSKTHSYSISIINDKIILGGKTPIKQFNQFVKPCMLRNGHDLFYLRAKFNGLQTIYVKYNLKDETLNNFRVISEKELIDGYFEDLGVMIQSQDINNITTNDQYTNSKIRNIQEKGDFLTEVFYKPVVSNFIYSVDQNLIIINHIDNQIEFYSEDVLENTIEIQYNKTENWLKHIVLDQETKEVYTLLRSTKGIELRRINIQTGESEFVAYLETDFPNFKTVKVHKGVAYFLGGEKVGRSSKMLLSKELY